MAADGGSGPPSRKEQNITSTCIHTTETARKEREAGGAPLYHTYALQHHNFTKFSNSAKSDAIENEHVESRRVLANAVGFYLSFAFTIPVAC